jgi:tRNA threonylcarbamoyladenosine biosynthesis protein TsaE
MNVLVTSVEETDLLGVRLATAIEPGLVISLVGELGAGKTRLVRAVATALGAAPETVNSPTYVLVQRYDARLPVYHFDTYRLGDAEEFADLGPEEYFSGTGVSFVEWGDRVADHLPLDLLRIEIAPTAETVRLIRIESSGPKSRAAISRLRNAMGRSPRGGFKSERDLGGGA